MGSGVKAGIGVLAIVVAVVLFVVLRDDGADSTTTSAAATTTTTTSGSAADKPGGKEPAEQEPAEPKITTIVVNGGQPVGGVEELSYEQGDQIQFIVESDVDEEVHVHGYDLAEAVSAGGKVEFDFPASLEGLFEVELEHSVVPIAEITVNPG